MRQNSVWCPPESPPLAARLHEDRPVFTQEQLLGLAHKIMAMSACEYTGVVVQHQVQSITRFANDVVQTTDDGETLGVYLFTRIAQSGGTAYLSTNQLDETSLRDLVARADVLTKQMIGSTEKLHVEMRMTQDTYLPAPLWHDSTVKALHTAREMAVPQLFESVRRQRCRTAGYIGVIARAEAQLTSDGITAFSEDTDCEISVSARTGDGAGTGVGWSGQAARDWTQLDPGGVGREAAEIAQRNRNPQALEPGRRTAILSSAAVAQLMRFLALHFDGDASDDGKTGFSKGPQGGSRFNQRIFDPRIQIISDPTDPEGSYRPWFSGGFANPVMTWIDRGVLKNLAYVVPKALIHGKKYSEPPFAMRVQGGDMPIEQMIAQCKEGIYVNRFSDVDVLNMETGLLSGVTRDGCFFVKNGKIDRPVKNFRFLDSPFFILNQLIALGPTRRTAFGYAPPTRAERDFGGHWGEQFDWPRRPMIVPPMLVRDFNFVALSDAV